MGSMIYFLTDQQRKQNAIDHINQLPDGNKWEVLVQERKNKRRLAQNRLYWMWVKPLANHFGYTDDQMHEELKYAFIGEETWTNRKGKTRVRPISTTTLSVEEFVNYLNKIDMLARRFNVHLPHPDDYLFAMMRD